MTPGYLIKLKLKLLGAYDRPSVQELPLTEDTLTRVAKWKDTGWAGENLYKVLYECRNKSFVRYLKRAVNNDPDLKVMELAKALLSLATHGLIQMEKDGVDRLAEVEDIQQTASLLLANEVTVRAVGELLDGLGIL